MTLQKIEFIYDIPDGYRFVRLGKLNKSELYLNSHSKVFKAQWDSDEYWIIVEKINDKTLRFEYRHPFTRAWHDAPDDPAFCEGLEYRIKPKTKTIRFRNWISCNGNVYVASDIEQIGQNYKWLGDWQNVEIEENE